MTVATRLGVSNPDDVATPAYFVGSEPVTAKRRGGGARAEPADYTALDIFKAYADAGVPDATIAREARATVAQIRRMRLRHGVRRKPGKPPAEARVHASAVELLGKEEQVVAMPVDDSPVFGKWEPPLLLIRTPLHYEKLVELIDFASERFSADDLAAALGLRLLDVVIAQRLAEHRHHG